MKKNNIANSCSFFKDSIRFPDIWGTGLFILIFILLQYGISAQNLTVKKVLDNNLFQLADGRTVYIYNITAPSVLDTNKVRKAFADDFLRFIKARFEGREFSFTFLQDTALPLAVKIIRKYPFSTEDMSVWFLTNGFAVYDLTKKETGSTEFLLAENSAKQKEMGIWDTDRERKYVEKFSPEAAVEAEIEAANAIKQKKENVLTFKPYFMLPVAIALAGLAVEQFGMYQDIQNSIDKIKREDRANNAKTDVSALEKQQNKKIINGCIFTVSSLAMAYFSFYPIEISGMPNKIDMKYHF